MEDPIFSHSGDYLNKLLKSDEYSSTLKRLDADLGDIDKKALSSAFSLVQIAGKLDMPGLTGEDGYVNSTVLISQASKVLRTFLCLSATDKHFCLRSCETLLTADVLKPLIQRSLTCLSERSSDSATALDVGVILMFALHSRTSFECLSQLLTDVNASKSSATALGPLSGLSYLKHEHNLSNSSVDIFKLKYAHNLVISLAHVPHEDIVTILCHAFADVKGDVMLEEHLAIYAMQKPGFLNQLEDLLKFECPANVSLALQYFLSRISNRLALHFDRLRSTDAVNVVRSHMDASFKAIIGSNLDEDRWSPTSASIEVLTELVNQNLSISLLEESAFINNLHLALKVLNVSLEANPANVNKLCDLIDDHALTLSLPSLLSNSIYLICVGLGPLGYPLLPELGAQFEFSNPPIPKKDSLFYPESAYTPSPFSAMFAGKSSSTANATSLMQCLALATDIQQKVLDTVAKSASSLPIVFTSGSMRSDELDTDLPYDGEKVNASQPGSVLDGLNLRLLGLEVDQNLSSQLLGLNAQTYAASLGSDNAFARDVLTISNRICDHCSNGLQKLYLAYEDVAIFCLTKMLTGLSESHPSLIPFCSKVLAQLLSAVDMSQNPLVKNVLMRFMNTFSPHLLDSSDPRPEMSVRAMSDVSYSDPEDLPPPITPLHLLSEIAGPNQQMDYLRTPSEALNPFKVGGLFLGPSPIWGANNSDGANAPSFILQNETPTSLGSIWG
ncbi:unnamed protein product [Kuraishia capsulata CBS 1993]|uniref:Uncharacterized protein n=1 Tax=Kuraishia capsulata CBS 1993 TaxID=1382522 RepID=W6MU21_9ASCO|nr:uncharacterized protein KUCA_T00001354001 [Kuraishia capsulata CBS 1993]CDK25385.1 unnamed protein product [Kuraishia capsulata CBS 1993]